MRIPRAILIVEWWMEDLFLEWLWKSFTFPVFLLAYCCVEQPSIPVLSSIDQHA
jgi:hypothetical protein